MSILRHVSGSMDYSSSVCVPTSTVILHCFNGPDKTRKKNSFQITEWSSYSRLCPRAPNCVYGFNLSRPSPVPSKQLKYGEKIAREARWLSDFQDIYNNMYYIIVTFCRLWEYCLDLYLCNVESICCSVSI